MKASLVLNYENRIALFYDEALGFVPEWVSIDLDVGTVFLGGSDADKKIITLDQIDQAVYDRISDNTEIFLIHLNNGRKDDVVHTAFVPLMLSTQI